MATDRAAKLFPTAGDAYRYCKKHGLEISMANDQLWDIAEALYDASQSSASEDLAESVRLVDDLTSSFVGLAAKQGWDLSPSDQAMLKKADALVSRLVCNEKISAEDASVLMQAEGTVSASYSDTDDCICCEGNHRYGTGVDWEITYGPRPREAVKGADLYDQIHRLVREMAHEQRVKVVLSVPKD